jgi:hypothetical protein
MQASHPWDDSPEASDRLVWLSLRWSADDDALDTIVELARKHDLVLYDPQGASFHSPADEHEGEPYVPTVGEYVRGALLTAFGSCSSSAPGSSRFRCSAGSSCSWEASSPSSPSFALVATAQRGWPARGANGR